MYFLCPVCSCKFTEKRNLVRHLKQQHANQWSCQRCQQIFNRYSNYCMHERVCLYKANGKRKAEDEASSQVKKMKDNVSYIGGALKNTLVDYRLNFEDENQGDIFKAWGLIF